MARRVTHTELSLGNHIYLYRLLRDRIGCGKQTFLPAVEEALEAEGWTAPDLGFASTREVLEALDDFIALTVFKGGRVYATVVAQPAWDEALAASAETKKAAGGKSWKRKRTDKALKPVAPRRRSAQKAEDEAEGTAVEPDPSDRRTADPDAAADATGDGAMAPRDAAGSSSAGDESSESDRSAEAGDAPQSGETECAAPESADAAAAAVSSGDTDTSASAPQTSGQAAEDREPGGTATGSPMDTGTADSAHAKDAAHPRPEAPAVAPAFSLTVTFDPDNADAGETLLSSRPAPAPDAAVPASASVTEQAQAAASPVQAPIDLGIYPVDFAAEVYCPGLLLSQLAALLPLGADALGIAGEWFAAACERGTAELGRTRIAFPLRYLRDGVRRTAIVRIKKRPGGAGAPWAITAVETDDESES